MKTGRDSQKSIYMFKLYFKVKLKIEANLTCLKRSI